MTPQEIIAEIHKLPPGGWEQIKELLDAPVSPDAESRVTEAEFARLLLAEGVISSIPDLSQLVSEDDEFEPVEVSGEPLSEMIIRERR
jgi:hypothetical protein